MFLSWLPVCFFYRRLVFTSSRLCNFVTMVEQLHFYYLRHRQTLLPLLRKLCYFTNHDVYRSFDISACVTKYDAVLFYYNKWCSNIQDFYPDTLHIFTQVMATRRQEATVLDSMFSCFPTNQRVGGYTNTRLKIRQVLCQDEAINQSTSQLWDLLSLSSL